MARGGGNGAEKRRGSPDLEALIQRKYHELPENQRKVADFLIRHIRDAPFLSVMEIEDRSGASKATVVRLAQSLGFSGFLEMRGKLIKGVQSQMRITEMFPLLAGTSRKETLTAVADQDVRNINQTINQLDPKVFKDVARMILNASRVYTLGLGISSLMARILAYSLSQVAIRSTSLVHDYETFIEQIHLFDRSDLIIAFSFPPYSKETIEVVRAAAGRKTRIVAVTDRVTSPVSLYAARVLPVVSQNMLFTNSFSAISVIINALTTEVALLNKAKALKNLKESEKLLERTGHYYAG
ncbi:MAG TPA: MurR/RpiR family transcriptional regulator [Bacteroidota bacterium]